MHHLLEEDHQQDKDQSLLLLKLLILLPLALVLVLNLWKGLIILLNLNNDINVYYRAHNPPKGLGTLGSFNQSFTQPVKFEKELSDPPQRPNTYKDSSIFPARRGKKITIINYFI